MDKLKMEIYWERVENRQVVKGEFELKDTSVISYSDPRTKEEFAREIKKKHNYIGMVDGKHKIKNTTYHNIESYSLLWME